MTQNNIENSMKKGFCRNCGAKLEYLNLTHCSSECLFANIQNTESISRNPIETWDDDPWV